MHECMHTNLHKHTHMYVRTHSSGSKSPAMEDWDKLSDGYFSESERFELGPQVRLEMRAFASSTGARGGQVTIMIIILVYHMIILLVYHHTHLDTQVSSE